MADEMETPRPVILITEDTQLPHVVYTRKLFVEDLIAMATSLVFDAIFEAWRQAHRVRVGIPEEYSNPAEFKKALEDPDPYESSYIFFCLK